MKNNIKKSLQVLLWLWFGIITSFTCVNVVNIARLETRLDSFKERSIINNHYNFQK